MKELILYAYQMNVEKFEKCEFGFLFHFENKGFCFSKLKMDEKSFSDLIAINQELLLKKFPTFIFITNVDSNYLTLYEGNFYVLMQVENPSEEYDLLKMIELQKKLKIKDKNTNLYRNDWAMLWAKKIDYLEYQVHERGREYPVILNSFSYYVGLAENAVGYYNTVIKNFPNYKPVLVLAHKRILYPNYCLSYLNPLNYIFDVEVRDIASYLKSMFFARELNVLTELKTYIEIVHPGSYELGLLYARLLYPSYYFDLHEKILEDGLEEDVLLPVIDLVSEYEFFLKQAWNLICSYVPIPAVDWIVKKEL